MKIFAVGIGRLPNDINRSREANREGLEREKTKKERQKINIEGNF